MPDFGLAQASCAIKVICDREQKGLRSITISLDDCYWPISACDNRLKSTQI
ncbi:hypothetical protein D3C80_429590 [compost metagenome]